MTVNFKMACKAAMVALVPIFLATLLVSMAAPSWAEETPTVNVIEVRGLARIDEGSVRAKISHKVGEPLDSEQVTKDIQDIYGMGYFEDVKAEVEPFEGGVRLIYEVKEKPVITRVDFQGNKKFDDDKLRENLAVTPGSIADDTLIQQSADSIKALYASKGYPLAEVVPVVRRLSTTQSLLTFQIVEGSKVKVRKIIIKGNKKLSKGKIKGAMKTGKWWLLSSLYHKGYYEKGQLNDDVLRIKDLYYDHGYIQVVVEDPVVEFTKNKKGIIITITVSEGEQFSVSSIGFSGNTVFTEDQLRDKLNLEVGKVFSKSDVQKDIADYSDMYGEIGYAAVNVIPDVVPDETAKTVGIVYRISEDSVYTVGKVSISGNIRTRDKVIRREVRMNEGDRYNSKLLKRSYQRINNTKFFEEVKLLPKLKHEAKKVDIDINVKERKTGSISVGAGYSTLDRVVGTIEYKQGNFRGLGQNVSVKAEVGSISNEYSLSFFDPWFLDYPISFSTSVYNNSRDYIDYTRKSTGFSVGFGKEISEYWRAALLYKLEQANITNIGVTASAVILDQAGKAVTSSITPSLVRDSKDNALEPHTGSENSLAVTYSGLGGDNYFLKLKMDSQWFFPVSEKTTLMIRGRYGHITGLNGEQAPLYERFYVGGITTIRGLNFGEGGPRDETGDVIGGLNEVILNVDFVFPLIQSINLKGVIFSDTGAAFDGSLDELRYTAGFGFRWISPVGPIRLEWGKNLNPKYTEADSRWEFSLGTFF